MEAILENFRMDSILWEAGYPFDEPLIDIVELLTEASTTPTTGKKGVIKKIIDFIKNIVKAIGEAVGRICNFIKSKFKRKTKTVDQILSDTLNKDFNAIHQISKKKTSTKSSTKSPTAVPKIINIKFAPNDTLLIHVCEDFLKLINNPIKHPIAKYAVPDNFTSIRFLMALHYIEDPGIIDHLITLFKNSAFLTIPDQQLSTIHSYIDHHNQSPPAKKSDHKIRLSDFDSFHKKVNELNQLIAPLEINPGVNPNSKLVELLNTVARLLVVLGMGINIITASMTDAYKLDINFNALIDTPEELAKFTKDCINMHVPSKYIYDAILYVTSADLNDGHPKNGQSRVVLFPKDKNIIYKIAYNAMGVRGNMAENHISRIVLKSKIPVNELPLVHVIKEYEDCIMLSMARTTNQSVSVAAANGMADKIKQTIMTYNLPFKLVDLHEDNFGLDNNGNLLLFDYGGMRQV